MLITAGVIDGSFNGRREYQKYNEAQREVEAQGITRPDEEVLKTAKQVRIENGEYILKHRSPAEVWQAIEVIAQRERFDKAVVQRLKEESGERPSGLRILGDVVAIAAGAIALLRARSK